MKPVLKQILYYAILSVVIVIAALVILDARTQP